MTDPFVTPMTQLLRDIGVADADIDEAASRGPGELVLLFADRAIVPGTERLTRAEVAERSGVSPEQAIAFWRALGFAEVPEGEPAFTEVDVDVLKRVASVLGSGLVDPELALQTTRVMGRSMAQVAAALVETIRTSTAEGGDDLPSPSLLAATPVLLDDIERWLGYVFRRHVVAEAKRAAALAETTEAGTAVVGFADLVGFAGITQSLDQTSLAAAVTSFETASVDVVGSHGGRIVKMIGDEVMFEAPSGYDGAAIALGLVETFANAEHLPDVRVGLALGPATRHQGDLFGEAPNLASRLVEEAYPGTVLVSESIRDALAASDDLAFRSVRPHALKGFGRTRYFALRRPGAEERRPRWKAPLLDT